MSALTLFTPDTLWGRSQEPAWVQRVQTAGAINNAAAPPFGSLDLTMRTCITFELRLYFTSCTGENACFSTYTVHSLVNGVSDRISV